MAAVQIQINQVALPPGVPGVAREDLNLGVVTLQAIGGPYLAYQWSIIDKPIDMSVPVKSAAVLTAPAMASTNVNPVDLAGTYYVQVLVDSGSGLGATIDDIARITFYAGTALAAAADQVPRRVIAFRETIEHNAPDVLDVGGNPEGWAREWRRWFANISRLSYVVTSPVSPGQDTYAAYAMTGKIQYSAALRTDGTTYVGLGPGTLSAVGDVRLPETYEIRGKVAGGAFSAVALKMTLADTAYPGQRVLRLGSAPYDSTIALECASGGLHMFTTATHSPQPSAWKIDTASVRWYNPGGSLTFESVNQGAAGQPGGTVYFIAPDGMAGGGGNAAGGGFISYTGAPKGAGNPGTVAWNISLAAYAFRAMQLSSNVMANTAQLELGENSASGLWAGLIKAADGAPAGPYVQFGLDLTLQGGTNANVTDAKPGNLYLSAGAQIAGGNKRPGADVTITPTARNDASKKPGFFVWYNGCMLTAEQAEGEDTYFSANQCMLWQNSAATGKSHLTAKTQATGGYLLIETVASALTVL